MSPTPKIVQKSMFQKLQRNSKKPTPTLQEHSVQFSRSVVSDSLWPHESPHVRPPCPSPTPESSLRLTSIESVMPSSHLILCHPLLLPPIPPNIRVFSNESTLPMRWTKYWSFSFSIFDYKEIPGLIFRMDWLDLLAVQGTLKSLLQHHSSKASILQKHQFSIVAVLDCIPTNSLRRFPFLCTLSSIYCL